MGLLDFLRRARRAPSQKVKESQDDLYRRSAELHKRATAEAKAGRLDAAVESVRSGLSFRREAGGPMRGDEGIRLAMMLHKAARHDEAWAEFNRLLGASGHASAWEAAFAQEAIYDKMRLCLQREHRYSEAVGLAVLAYCCQVKAFYVQSLMAKFVDIRTAEDVARVRSAEFFAQRMTPHLRKAGALDALPALYTITDHALASLPRVPLGKVRQEVAALLTGHGQVRS